MQMEELSAGHGALTAVRAGAGSDIVVLHSLLADRHAFDAVLPALSARHRVTLFNLPGFHGSQPTPLALMDAHVHRPPPEVSTRIPWLTRSFDLVLARAIAKDPDRRYESCTELVHHLTDAVRNAQNT